MASGVLAPQIEVFDMVGTKCTRQSLLGSGARRLATILLVVWVASLLAGPAAGSSSSPASLGCPGQSRQGAWLRLAAPRFASGAQQLAGYAVDPADPARLLVTNGAAIETSADGGCQWTASFALPATPSAAMPFSAATAQVTQLALTGDGHGYALIDDANGPQVLASSDGGESWAVADSGLPPASSAGAPPELAVAAGGSRLYLVLHSGSSLAGSIGGDLLAISSDHAASWSLTPLAAGLVAASTSDPTVTGLAVDPADPASLWAATSLGLYHSVDSGANWTYVNTGSSAAMAAVEVYDTGGATPAQVGVFQAGSATGYVSTDGGASFSTITAPAPVGSAVTVGAPANLVVATSAGVFGWSAGAWVLLQNGSPLLTSVTADLTSHPALYGCACSTGGAVWVQPNPASGPGALSGSAGGPTPGPPPTPDCSPPPHATPPTIPRPVPADLSPSARALALPAGGSTTLSYQFVQQAQELDVFFLEDNGPKSEFSHCAFQSGAMWAVGKLATERTLAVGLGNFGDYTGYSSAQQIGAGGGGGGIYSVPSTTTGVYFLDSPIGRPDSAFYNAITDLGSAWEGGWNAAAGDQADLAALYQAVTGVGQVVHPGDPDNIPAGLSAGFHQGAFPVVMLVAGMWFDSPSRTAGYPGPHFGQVESALRARGVQVTGVWVDNSANKESSTPNYAAYNGLADLTGVIWASGARSVIPVGCGGGLPGSSGGAPVCVYEPTTNPAPGGTSSPLSMGPQLLGLLTGLADPQPVSLAVLSGAAAVVGIAPRVRAGVDVLLPHTVSFAVTLRCPARPAGPVGQTIPIELGGQVGAQVQATAQLELTCDPVPPPPPPAQQVSRPVPAGLVPFNPPAQLPAAEPGTNPVPNPAQAPQAQTQPASQANPQPGIAAAEAEQLQYAEEYAATGSSPAPPLALWCGVLAVVSIICGGLRWRWGANSSRARAGWRD